MADALVRVGRDFSPRVECPARSSVRADTVVLIDLDGLEGLFGEPREIAAELQASIMRLAGDSTDAAPLTATRIALAGTRAAAELVARTTRAPVVIARGAEARALAPLPVSTLTPLGAPADLLATLDRWGIRTLGEFAALPRARLASRIGQDGLLWQRRSRGEDDRPLVPTPPEERFEDTIDLEWPIEGVEPLAFILGRLLDPLCERLERRDRAVAAIELRLRLTVSRTWQMRRLELPAPIRDARMLRTLLCLDLESRPPAEQNEQAGSVDRVGLFLEPTPARVCQFSLLARPAVSPEQATTLMARLRALMGHDRCGTPRPVDTHRPGAFALAPDWTGESGQSGGSGRKEHSDHAAARQALARLASDPPDRPALPDPPLRALRRLRHPIPARVAVERHRPVRVTTDRRGWNGGRVVWCSGPWRSSGEWWHVVGTGGTGRTGGSGRKEHSDHTEARRISTRPVSDLPAPPALPGLPAPPALPGLPAVAGSAGGGGPWDRTEWDVALSDGSACILHEDRQRGGWFVDAVID